MAVSQRGLACLVGGGVAWAVGLAWRVGWRGGRLVVAVAGSAPCRGGHGNTMMGRKLMGEGIERVSLAWLDEGWKWEEMGGVKQEPGRRDLLKENRVERRLNLWCGKASLSARPRPDTLPDMARKSLPCHPNTTHKTPQPPTHPDTTRKTPPPTCRHTVSTRPCHHRPTTPPQHAMQDPAVANLSSCHPDTDARPRHRRPSTPSQHGAQDPSSRHPDTARKTRRHAAPTRIQGPVTTDPPRRPNMARKTPPLPTRRHAAPTWTQDPPPTCHPDLPRPPTQRATMLI
ncbi:hypothetical protein EDB89DRAFT_1905043 [Lactarius sanguifluus]|nr:hypothetical protein EDB89DRAFT_1905043 [Lactarius sanguifluus]